MIQKFLGCMYGLALGDALGAPVEFMSLEEIKRKYGDKGIRDLDEWSGFSAGFYTDDTQMSLATAVGMIRATRRYEDRGICHPPSVVYHRYLEWLKTQDNRFERRGPGNTCLSALGSGKMGTIEEKINNSKGCGGVMRTAPIGLLVGRESAFQLGAECAAITHGHPSGYLSAGFLSELIWHLAYEVELKAALEVTSKTLIRYEGHEETLEKVRDAQKLAFSMTPTKEAIQQLGEGWIGEEALAIAIYCALKFPRDWQEGILAAINHSGDSDSTGSIAGAILGTLNGVDAIPSRWIEQLENTALIRKITEDMLKSVTNIQELSNEEYPGC